MLQVLTFCREVHGQLSRFSAVLDNGPGQTDARPPPSTVERGDCRKADRKDASTSPSGVGGRQHTQLHEPSEAAGESVNTPGEGA